MLLIRPSSAPRLNHMKSPSSPRLTIPSEESPKETPKKTLSSSSDNLPKIRPTCPSKSSVHKSPSSKERCQNIELDQTDELVLSYPQKMKQSKSESKIESPGDEQKKRNSELETFIDSLNKTWNAATLLSKYSEGKDERIQELEEKYQNTQKLQDKSRKLIKEKDLNIQELEDKLQQQIKEKYQHLQVLRDESKIQIQEKDQKIQDLEAKVQQQIKEKYQHLQVLQEKSKMQIKEKVLKIQDLEVKLQQQSNEQDQKIKDLEVILQQQIKEKDQNIQDLGVKLQQQTEENDQRIKDLEVTLQQQQTEENNQKIKDLEAILQQKTEEKDQEIQELQEKADCTKLQELQEKEEKIQKLEKKCQQIQELLEKSIKELKHKICTITYSMKGQIKDLEIKLQQQSMENYQQIKDLESKLQESESELNRVKLENENPTSSSKFKKVREQGPNTSVLSVKRVPQGKEQELKNLVDNHWDVLGFKIRKDLSSENHSYVSITIDSSDGAAAAKQFFAEVAQKTPEGYEWLSEIAFIPTCGSVLRISELPEDTEPGKLITSLTESGNILDWKLETYKKNSKSLYFTVQFEEIGAAQQGKVFFEENSEYSEVSCSALDKS